MFPIIEGDCDVTQASVNKTISNFHILESISTAAPITFILNSYGGDIYQALGLYDFIKGLQSEVHIKAVGACMSAATLILQAGDRRLITANTTFMMHIGSAEQSDHANNVYRWAIHGEKVIKPKMKDIYVSRMIKMPKENDSHLSKRINALLDFDTILTAEQVVKLGLADEII
jgi:ATP-dependent Clp protease protease subunit